MNEKTNKNNNVVEIDLKRIFKAVWKRIWVVGIASVLCAIIALLGTIFFVTPLYQSSAMFYVNNSSISVGDASLSISSGDVVASKSLVETYIVILNSRTCLNDVIDYAELDYTPSQLKSMISASSVNDTEVFQIVVTGPDPVENEEIANAIAYILPNKISNIVEGTTAKVVDYAVKASVPSSPNRMTNTIVGFFVGLVLSVGLIVLLELFDNTIRSEEDVTQSCNHPILAAVPDMTAHSKGGHYYGYGQKKGKKKSASLASPAKETIVVGEGISFAATEAYKLLRTKIEFSFADNQECRVIGVSSAMAGEGKSLSSTNLAHSLAQLDKRVLLIDCDMRRPSLAAKLGIQKSPGLSNYLTNRMAIYEVIQECGAKFGETEFGVITAGRIPPNPIELLSSTKMEKMIGLLRDNYDYIILDLPPVGEVSDAMTVAKLADGIILVVSQDYCTRSAFTNAINQFEFVNSRILGVVINRSKENGHGYGYGKRYNKQYYTSASNGDAE